MFKYFQLLPKYSVIFFIGLFASISLKANTVDNLKNQFVALGGSIEGFNKILQVVQKSQSSSNQLKDKITQVHNKNMFEIMVAPDFDAKAYKLAYNSLELDKAQLVNQNLNDMITLLSSLSLKDRQAYAKLLYGIRKDTSNKETSNTVPGEATQSSNTNASSTSTSVGNTNTDTNHNANTHSNSTY